MTLTADFDLQNFADQLAARDRGEFRASKRTAAAAYIRMSSDRQEKSPAQQRDEIKKLAERESYEIVEWFSDEAITGDSGTDQRSGLANLLAGAKAGRFTVILAWHTNRISREDPLAAFAFYHQLRDAGVKVVHTCDKKLALDDFSALIDLLVTQKGSKDYLPENSARTLRGKIAAAKLGHWLGGPPPYGYDRAEYDASGNFLRRLAPDELLGRKGSHQRLLPSMDQRQIAAVRYAYERFDSAEVSYAQLARELHENGFPPPGRILKAWSAEHITKMLRTPAYAGIACFGIRGEGGYYRLDRDNIVAVPSKRHPRRWKELEETITKANAHEAIVEMELFQRVYQKAKRRHKTKRVVARDHYPFSGLLYCEHCGKRMRAQSATITKGRNRKKVYAYQTYVCRLYASFGNDRNNNPICGHHSIRAERILTWLYHELKEAFLGPSRAALVQKIEATVKNRNDGENVERLENRIGELSQTQESLRHAIRMARTQETIAELTDELEDVKEQQRDGAAELAAAKNPKRESEKIADELREMCELLTSPDPAKGRLALREFVAKIECRFDRIKSWRNTLCPLLEGTVYLKKRAAFAISDTLKFTGADLGSRWNVPKYLT